MDQEYEATATPLRFVACCKAVGANAARGYFFADDDEVDEMCGPTLDVGVTLRVDPDRSTFLHEAADAADVQIHGVRVLRVEVGRRNFARRHHDDAIAMDDEHQIEGALAAT